MSPWVVLCPEEVPMRIHHESRNSRSAKLGALCYQWELGVINWELELDDDKHKQKWRRRRASDSDIWQ